MKTAVLAWRGYIVAVHLALATLMFHDGIPGRLAVKLGFTQPPPDVTAQERHARLVTAIHIPRDQQAPPGAAVFLGDSHTELLYTPGVAPLPVNHGISGLTSQELLSSMDRFQSLRRASVTVITIGTNDLNQGRADGIDQRYRAILGKVPPNVPVIMSSVPPSARLDVRPVVEAARAACAADRRCTFVDAFRLLSTAGVPTPGVLRDDGMHLSAKGYELWSEALRHAIGEVRIAAVE